MTVDAESPAAAAESPTAAADPLAVVYLTMAIAALLFVGVGRLYVDHVRPHRQLHSIVADALESFDTPPLPTVQEADRIVRDLVASSLTEPAWFEIAPLRCQSFAVDVDARSYRPGGTISAQVTCWRDHHQPLRAHSTQHLPAAVLPGTLLR